MQEVSLSGFSAGNQFTLTYFNGVQAGTTALPGIAYTGVPLTDAASIQGALNTLLTGLGFAAGSVAVTPVDSTDFTVTFSGLAATNIFPLLGTVTSGTGTVSLATIATYAPQTLIPTVWSPTEINLTGTSVGTAVITDLPGTSQLFGGMQVSGNGITAGTTILSLTATTVTLSNPCSTIGSVALSFETAPPHVITATFTDSTGVFAAPVTASGSPLEQVVNQNTVGITLSSPDVVAGTSPVYAQNVNINANVAPGAAANLTSAQSPTGTLTFIVSATTATAGFTILDVGNTTTINVGTSAGMTSGQLLEINAGTNMLQAMVLSVGGPTSVTIQTTAVLGGAVGNTMASGAVVSIAYTPVAFTPPDPATLSARTATQLLAGNLLLAPGVHTVVASYDADDPDYAATVLPAPFTFTYTVLSDSTTLAFTPTPVNSALGQTAIINVLVSPGLVGSPGHPQGAVTFYDGNPATGGTLLNASTTTTASFLIPALGNSTSISVASTAGIAMGQYLYIAGASSTILALVTGVGPGNSVTIQTTTIVAGNAGNTIAFGASVALATTVNPLTGAASLSIATLVLGSHNIYAVFTTANNDYTGITNSYPNFIVQKAVTQTLIQTPLPSAQYGTASVFTVNVSENPSIALIFPALAPTGNVTLYAQSGAATTTPGFVIPAVGTPVTIGVASTAGMVPGTSLVDITDGTNTIIATVGAVLAGPPRLTITPTTIIAGSAGNAMLAATVSTVINVGSGNLSGGDQATITTLATGANALPVGTIPLIAVYSGDANFAVSADTSRTITVNGAPANVTVTNANPNPGVFTGPITLTASVASPITGLPLGAGSFVTFWDGPVGTGINLNALLSLTSNLAAGNTATLLLPAGTLSAGLHTIYASYTDTVDGHFTNGTDTPLANYAVDSAPTTVTSIVQTWTPPPAGAPVYGETETLTATVTSPGGALPVTGNAQSSVAFVDVTNPLAPVSLGTGFMTAGGTASITLTTLGAGVHTIKATYTDSHDAYFAPSLPFTQGGIDVTAASTTISTLTAAPSNPSPLSATAVTYTATVITASPSNGAPVNAGTVSFWDVAPNSLTTVTGAGFTMPAVGSTTSASFGVATTLNETLYIASGGNAFIATVLTAGAANAAVTIRDTALLSGVVVPISPGTAVFAAALLTPSPVTVNAATGQASATAVYSTIAQLGTHTIWATYNPPTSGTINYLAATPVATTQTVLKDSKVTVAALASKSYGQQMVYTVTVTSPIGGGAPTGNVVLTFGANTYTSTALVAGGGGSTATITVPGGVMNAGSTSLLFTYINDLAPTNTWASSTATISQSVGSASTSMALGSSVPTTSEFGQSVTFTATLTVVATVPAGTPGLPLSGTVTIKDSASATPLQVVTLTGSSAGTVTYNANSITITYTTTALTQAAHTITAVYSGSGSPANFALSNTASISQNVVKDGTLGTLSSTAWTQGQPGYSGSITFTKGGSNSAVTGAGAAPGVGFSALPAGLSVGYTNVNATTATITLSGTPTAAPGTYSPTITVTDAANVTVSKMFTIVINAMPTLAPSGGALPAGSYKTAYSTVITINGGTPAFKNLSVTGLPAGFTYTLSGTQIKISGTPTAVGSFNSVNVSVTDADGAIATGTYSLTIAPAATTITFSSSASTALVGTAVKYTAVVTSAGRRMPMPGVVAINDSVLGFLGNATFVSVSGNSATYALTYTYATALSQAQRGARSVTAMYTGSNPGSPTTELFNASATSSAASVNVVNTLMSLGASTTAPGPNALVTFTATFYSPGGSAAGQTIFLYDNGVQIASATLSGSGPTYTVTFSRAFGAGTKNVISASFPGQEPTLDPSTASVTVTVSTALR